MMFRTMRRLHKDQRGFTLIELLVVITVLGVLAAIVSISLLGVTSNARTKARQTEYQTIQTAFDAMLGDQQVDPSKLAADCTYIYNSATPSTTGFTNNMLNFPVGGAKYTAPGSLVITVLATFYTRQPTTQYQYACDANGNVYQLDSSSNKVYASPSS